MSPVARRAGKKRSADRTGPRDAHAALPRDARRIPGQDGGEAAGGMVLRPTNAPTNAPTAPMVRQQGDDVLIDILVQPRASRARIGPVMGDRLKLAVTAPPVDGKANAAAIQALARALGIPRRRVEIASGASARRKTVRITGISRERVLACIPEVV